MSLRVGKTFCKGPRTAWAKIDPRVCVACVWGRGEHTCGKKDETKKEVKEAA